MTDKLRHHAAATTTGLVIAAHGRHYLVEDESGDLLQCFPRGKKSLVAVGDRVRVETTGDKQGSITDILPRKNLLYRSDQFKSKLLAANIDQLLITLATEPNFSEDLLGRALVAAESLGLTPILLLNKTDLTTALPLAQERLAPYRALGYTVLAFSARTAPAQALALLRPWVEKRSSLLLGQSGMGKSSLLNLMIPGADVQTREISSKLDSGKHTTTFTRLYHLPEDPQGTLIDSPGFQEFGLHHLSEGMLERAFPDFRPFLGECRFYNCSHLHEPGCAILQTVHTGKITPRRHALYAQLLHESRQQKPY